MQSAQQQHLDDLMQTCREHHKAEFELQMSFEPMLNGKLEQLAGAWKEGVLARINKIHDHEVIELKKQLDGHNWEDMKALAKKHRDKNELARYMYHCDVNDDTVREEDCGDTDAAVDFSAANADAFEVLLLITMVMMIMLINVMMVMMMMMMTTTTMMVMELMMIMMVMVTVMMVMVT